MINTQVECGDPELFASALEPGLTAARVNVDPEAIERGLVQLVLSLVELLRRLLERQAIRRMEAGSLTREEIDRVGQALYKLECRIKELQEHFGIDDLNISLGPLGNLLD